MLVKALELGCHSRNPPLSGQVTICFYIGQYARELSLSTSPAYAPFLSTAQRHLEGRTAKSQLPAPGSYDIAAGIEQPVLMVLEEETGTKVYNLSKPHSFFRSKVDRFRKELSDVPGPGF